MSAKNGLTRSFRLIGCLMAAALMASALFASAASAKTLKPTAYLALGDSLSFGYKGVTFTENKVKNAVSCAAEEKAKCEPASSFEGGFVGYFGSRLAKVEKKAGNELTTVNLGCPGETSDGMIGHTYGGPGAEYNPCGYNTVEGWPLKTEYAPASQLEAAAAAIATKAYGEVKAVTLQIGSNDELQTVAKCETPSYDVEHGFATLLACIEHEAGPEGYAFSGGLFSHILTNIGVSVAVLRGAGYSGTIEILGFYNPDANLLEGSDALDKILNENLEGLIAGEVYGPGIKLAQPFPVFNPEAALFTPGESSKEHAKKITKEQKAICKLTEMCTHSDVHPTHKGYQVLGKLLYAAF